MLQIHTYLQFDEGYPLHQPQDFPVLTELDIVTVQCRNEVHYHIEYL